MRIAYIADYSVFPSRAANSIQIVQMCHAYAQEGHDVELVAPVWETTADDAEAIHEFYGVEPVFGVRRVGVPSALPRALYFGGLPLVTTARSRPDVVHTRNIMIAVGSALLARLPTLLELHRPPPASGTLHRLFRMLSSSKNLLGVIVITEALENMVRERHEVRPPLIVAPDGVDARWLTHGASREQARASLGLEESGSPLAVYTGHLYPGRGVDLIVELARRLPEHRFLLVGGNDEQVHDYRGRTRDMTNIRFAGFVPPSAVRDYLHAADVLLMPYADNVAVHGGGNTAAFASPMKMFEYMAAGRPIVASTLPVLQEVLEDRRTALLVPYDRPDEWADALVTLRDQPAEAGRLGDAASREVAKYTWDRRARAILGQIGA